MEGNLSGHNFLSRDRNTHSLWAKIQAYPSAYLPRPGISGHEAEVCGQMQQRPSKWSVSEISFLVTMNTDRLNDSTVYCRNSEDSISCQFPEEGPALC